MPELPEIASRAREMNEALIGKIIQAVEILQPKCLNIEPGLFAHSVAGSAILQAHYHGKWILLETTKGWILINEGMGGEILLVTRQSLPEKYRLIFDFTDGTCLAINFWWFGSVHFVQPGGLPAHEPTAKLGPNALDLSLEEFKAIFYGQRGRLKMFLLDQTHIAGIGNAYIHDILFFARLHPLRTIQSLSEDEIEALYHGIRQGLTPALEKGGAFYELNLYGQKGGFQSTDIVIGYRENEPCPACGTPIVKIKTGGTSGFICPHCQPAG